MASLLRIVVDPAGPPSPGGPVAVVLDLRQRLPGRGAWLHDDPGCLDTALARRAVGRALRRQDPLDLSALEHLRQPPGQRPDLPRDPAPPDR